MYYIIDKAKGYVTAQHETEALCKQHINNSASLFGLDRTKLVIAKGAKERDRILKELKS